MTSLFEPTAQITGLYPPVAIHGDSAVGFSAPTYASGLSLTPIMQSAELLFLTQVEEGAWSITQTITPPPKQDESGELLDSAWQYADMGQGVCGAIGSYQGGEPWLFVYEIGVNGSWVLNYSTEIMGGSVQGISVGPTVIAIKFRLVE